jgi:hypothetical protein
MSTGEHKFVIAWDLPPKPGSRKLRIAGELWYAYEDDHPEWGRSLIFESVKVARRVRNYPANWRELTDDQLYALSWSR